MALRLFARRSAGSRVRISCTRRERENGPICGEVAPITKPTASTAASGSALKATYASASSASEFRVAASRSTRRCPILSAAAPSSGPTSAEPSPSTAAFSPPSATDSRAATTSVSVPTTIIAKGKRAMKAIGK